MKSRLLFTALAAVALTLVLAFCVVTASSADDFIDPQALSSANSSAFPYDSPPSWLYEWAPPVPRYMSQHIDNIPLGCGPYEWSDIHVPNPRTDRSQHLTSCILSDDSGQLEPEPWHRTRRWPSGYEDEMILGPFLPDENASPRISLFQNAESLLDSWEKRDFATRFRKEKERD